MDEFHLFDVVGLNNMGEGQTIRFHLRCGRCNYDLYRRKVLDRCPECGKAVGQSLVEVNQEIDSPLKLTLISIVVITILFAVNVIHGAVEVNLGYYIGFWLLIAVSALFASFVHWHAEKKRSALLWIAICVQASTACVANLFYVVAYWATAG